MSRTCTYAGCLSTESFSSTPPHPLLLPLPLGLPPLPLPPPPSPSPVPVLSSSVRRGLPLAGSLPSPPKPLRALLPNQPPAPLYVGPVLFSPLAFRFPTLLLLSLARPFSFRGGPSVPSRVLSPLGGLHTSWSVLAPPPFPPGSLRVFPRGGLLLPVPQPPLAFYRSLQKSAPANMGLCWFPPPSPSSRPARSPSLHLFLCDSPAPVSLRGSFHPSLLTR